MGVLPVEINVLYQKIKRKYLFFKNIILGRGGSSHKSGHHVQALGLEHVTKAPEVRRVLVLIWDSLSRPEIIMLVLINCQSPNNVILIFFFRLDPRGWGFNLNVNYGSNFFFLNLFITSNPFFYENS